MGGSTALTETSAPTGTAAARERGAVEVARDQGRRRRADLLLALAFLGPALVLLGALVVYPIVFTVVRSLYDRGGDTFVGLGNYVDIFTAERTRTALRNNFIWVVAGPTLATAIGLVYAVLAERVRWQTVFKVAVFMPMAISALATGVIFRLVYESDPQRGLANAVITSVTDTVRTPGQYRGARPSLEGQLQAVGGAFVTTATYRPGAAVTLGLLAIRPERVPDGAVPARVPSPAGDELAGVVWLDFTRGGGGERGVVDPGELGLPGITVAAVAGDQVLARDTTAEDGSFVLTGLDPGSYQLRLEQDAFRAPWTGLNWLGPSLITPAVIGAWLWIWVGFAMIVIGAGLAAIPREVLDAARVDGANEWQVFRRVTAPLLSPVLIVVFVTLMINVLKIFDLVLVIPPGAVQDNANVLALEMWRVSFGGARDQGMGSALAVVLFLLVVPAIAFNIRRFKREGS
jgi:ABC-type sugar transport system permease subunit